MSEGFKRGRPDVLRFDSLEVLEDVKTGEIYIRFFREQGEAKPWTVCLPKRGAAALANLILAPLENA